MQIFFNSTRILNDSVQRLSYMRMIRCTDLTSIKSVIARPSLRNHRWSRD